jgi:hypothetical protein
MTDDVSKMSDADLRDNLITLDYRGKDFKREALNELLRRAVLKGCSECGALTGHWFNCSQVNKIGREQPLEKQS